MSAARDHEAGLRDDRLDEQLMRCIERDRARRRLAQRVERRFGRARVERAVAERSAGSAVGLDEELAARLEVLAFAAQQRRERDGLSAGRGGEHVAEQIATAKEQRALAGFDGDPHRAAADESGVPGEVFGELVFTQRCVAGLENTLGFFERVAFDAATTERSGEASEIVDEQLRAHDLRRAPRGANDGADREAAALALEFGHPRVDRPHAFILGSGVIPAVRRSAHAVTWTRVLRKPAVPRRKRRPAAADFCANRVVQNR